MEIERLYALYRNSAGITTDSRTIRKGEIFFALKGPAHDGNRHAVAALESGALAAVVDDKSLSGERIIVVDDVLSTMSALAVCHRRRLTMPVIGITGSNGKTTTKELLTAVLSRKGRVHSTPGNLNNHIGVPLTLLSAPDDVAFLIVEMGANHTGEIAALCRTARPTHGIITNIGTAHIEGFGSFENVIKAKRELYQWLGENGGTVIFNDDNPILKEITGGISSLVAYSSPGSHTLRAEPEENDSMLLRVSAEIDGVPYKFPTRLFGAYNTDNVRSAMAVGLFFGVPADDIIEAISSYMPANNRSQITETDRNTVICDAYNANPSSMEKAIGSFAALKAAKKMVILGDMLELGTETAPGHSAVIRQLRQIDDLKAVLIGPHFREAAAGFPAKLFGSSEAAAEWLRSEKPEGYTILVKGSRGMMLEKVYPLL
ncbi:MAG: UDP-N-acetylmuramoyl-tripeptide--D-alanyl-D-alanine ligase [Bacteroidales bacterium]|nr:UDP-N-acetylmuramoyl-tripeptide--D-alanyl-D-alanine ligase [Bacteroidales bacterium]MCB9027584.1 UDP-N-acetylmuramoyl-tripeptide--D-alanyl-D-alanine ligase [Bacteroidales bacterium]HOO65395.1 UDP-N-acetylmuramoyl-tripeptide--D-alanyl-D-alanine ligase [Bacteroidales bacterium]HPE21748.1 UDP-N-acetylmuramoyl-tripeptide--D-alanyl-D-alanine ligase [Bacteroidales bacterium]HPJ04031.1 UDP-N-acetylmuramoyl-tripeptide--D-alanyl-D-alanine ligase [Bacteroidales bacterium]